MSLTYKRHKSIVRRFQNLLRSGKDYTVLSMCEEAGKKYFLDGNYVRHIINSHYQKIINQDMISFIEGLNCSREEEIKLFSDKFKVCRRESILLIRYIRTRNGR